MHHLHVHKEASKAFKKSPKRIREKIFKCLKHLKDHGTKNCPFPIAPLKGTFKKFRYYEAKIDKDYRIIFRIEDRNLYIRTAGTHNALGTG